MRKALLFNEKKESILVDATEVLEGKYSRKNEFVDPEYEYKVIFVCRAKNNGNPYFRLYYSLKEYREKYPDKADKYEIIAEMRRFQESSWHINWKNAFSSFCSLEKCIKNPISNKWKFADAFYDKNNTCIEFQHSFIKFDFDARNRFYSELGMKCVWLYDLSNNDAKVKGFNEIEILEDNSNGFFRIAEDPKNLSEQQVYIQTKSGKIYRVKELRRKEISEKGRLSTIRCFTLSEVYTADEFIEAVKSNTFSELKQKNSSCEEKKQDLVNSINNTNIVPAQKIPIQSNDPVKSNIENKKDSSLSNNDLAQLVQVPLITKDNFLDGIKLFDEKGKKVFKCSMCPASCEIERGVFRIIKSGRACSAICEECQKRMQLWDGDRLKDDDYFSFPKKLDN